MATTGRTDQTRVVRVRAWRRDPGVIYVGRAAFGWPRSDWANPFVVGKDGTREEVVARYRDYLLTQRPDLLARLPELRGRTLGCWCAPPGGELRADDEPYVCHGQVLAALADASPGGE